jgi:hypothetical protein
MPLYAFELFALSSWSMQRLNLYLCPHHDNLNIDFYPMQLRQALMLELVARWGAL